MAIASIMLAGVLGTIPKPPVELTLDFTHATAGTAYQIVIKLFNKSGKQVGKVQTITLGAAATVDDICLFFNGAMGDLGMTATPVAGTKKVLITGKAADFKRIEYSTFSRKGENWVPNVNIKGPTSVEKPGATAPTFVVNPKPL